jgi:hypothetical protein
LYFVFLLFQANLSSTDGIGKFDFAKQAASHAGALVLFQLHVWRNRTDKRAAYLFQPDQCSASAVISATRMND